MNKKISLIIIIAIILSISLGIVIGKFLRENKTTKNTGDIFYIVQEDISVEKLADEFKKKEVINSRIYFKLYSKYMNLEGNIKNSKIIIKPDTSISDLIIKLKSDEPDFAVVTIPEGFRVYQIAERLEKNKLADKNTFVNVKLNDLESDKLINDRKDVILSLEGFLFPDTYFIPLSFSEKDIASLMFNRFKTIFTEKHVNRSKELGFSINDIVNIASLIEREAVTESERSRIAGVIYNRLKKKMLLQVDATVIYANTKGEGHLSRVLYSHLKFDSKYNTYLYKGLPPGPIASPGKASIEAALYPEQHDYLYYVAGNNGHVFSSTYEEHLANVKKYMK